MAIAYADRVQETTATTGTGTVTLAGAVSGFQSFTTAFSTGVTVFYCITSGSLWEVGYGVFTASGTTLTRATVLAGSSGAGNKITLAGTSNVFCVRPAETMGGTYIGTTLLTSASGTFTTGAYTTKIKIRGVAGGGAGGGKDTTAYHSGGGGGSGSYAEKTFAVSPSTGYSYTCGAGGTANSGAAGGNGNNSTFVVGATTVTCNGGSGGFSNQGWTSGGGAGGTVSTNGDVNLCGQDGHVGFGNSSIVGLIVGGAGGASMLGPGGPEAVQNNGTTTGQAPSSGYGGGGGGAGNNGTSALSGGAGAAGCWIVDEYA